MGAAFPHELLMKSVYGKRGITTIGEFGFYSKRYDIYVDVPTGTYSNFGSIPAIIPPWIAPRVGKIKEAYVIHDYLYQIRGKLPNGERVTKHQADMILFDAMLELGVHSFRRGIILAGVEANLIAKYKWDKETPESGDV